MNDKIFELLEKLPAENLINLMWEALDIMQSNNSRTKQDCILMAAGAKETDNGWTLDNETLYQNTKQSSLIE
jgi:hypothetical protein